MLCEITKNCLYFVYSASTIECFLKYGIAEEGSVSSFSSTNKLGLGHKFSAMNCILGTSKFLTGCNVTCGQGYQIWGQPILSEARNGGTCDQNLQAYGCYVNSPCPCIKEWSPWSPCSSSCGAGTRSRNEKVVKEADFGGECPNLPGNANEVCVGLGEDCPLLASMIGLVSGLVFCLVIMSVVIIYLYRKKRETQVLVKKVEVPVPLDDYQYDNDDLYQEDNKVQSQIVVPDPVAPAPEVDPYEALNYAEDNINEDYQDENYNTGGIYYTYFDENGRFVRTNTIVR